MSRDGEKTYKKLAVRSDSDGTRTSYFSIDDELGAWIDPRDDAISWNILKIYGISDKEDDTDEDEIEDDDFSLAVPTGKIFGCHIAKSLIINLGEDPYVVCDDVDGDLEAMYSVLKEHEDEDDFIDWFDDIFYIHEIEFEPEYQGMGYEEQFCFNCHQ